MMLFELGKNETGLITDILLDETTKNRLHDMGIRTGTCVKFLRKAPFGGCIEFGVLGYKMALRQSEAEKIIVERVYTL